MPQELLLFRTKNRKSCRVGFDAGALVIQNQNGVQGILENGFEFASGSMKSVGRFLIFPAQEDQESGMEGDRERKSSQDSRKKVGGQRKVVKLCCKYRAEKNDRRQKD